MADDRRGQRAGRRHPRRSVRPGHRIALGTGVLVAVVAGGLALTGALSATAIADTPLYAEGIGMLPDGSRTLVPAGVTPSYLPGSRVLDPGVPDATAERLAAADRAWLASGTTPGADGPYADMVADALLDLHALLLEDGAAIAAWSPNWRYVWPRDAAFAAVALARTGHADDALEVLAFLDRVQADDGDFEARYLPDGSGPPDDRGEQTDGTGWALWAAAAVVAEIDDPGERADALVDLDGLVDRSTRRLVELVEPDGLPPASSDYWEVSETRLTLGTAAPVLAGLQAATTLLTEAGDDDLAQQASDAATVTQEAIADAFGPGGYGRYADRSDADADAASALLLPPFVDEALPGAEQAWRASAAPMARPAGGLAPGAGWREDGVSWTPETALYALAAASLGDDALASTWLTWLDAHRTRAGAIPEKVLADGSPAAVAPLAWTAACVILAVDALDVP